MIRAKKIFLFFIVMMVFSGFAFGAIPASERAALIALYNSTNGDSWYNNSGWKTPPLHTDGFAMPGTEGNWKGIYLSGDHVTNISLYKNHLTGSLPSQIGNLVYIGYMNIGDNYYLSGPIPPEMGNLANLTYLNLHDMDLTGTIPPQLGNLTKLTYLDTGDNTKLTGAIPSTLGNLVNLTYLNLHDNDLEGTLPPELGNLANLQELHLHDNDITGSIPTQMGNLVNLTKLNLDDNDFSGTIPPGIGNLTKLSVLILSDNQLSGEIPSSIINLNQLYTMDINYNCLTCSNPTVRAWLNDKNSYWGCTQTKCGYITPSIAITSPNGGEYWVAGSVHNITWMTAGPVGTVKLEYSTDNGTTWNTIGLSHHNDWFYTWTVPNIFSSNCLVRVSDDDSYTSGAPSDTCDNVFAVSSTDPAVIGLDRSQLVFGANTSGTSTGAQTVHITNTGSGTMGWTATSNSSWLGVTPSSGTGPGSISVSVNPPGLPAGTFTGTVSVGSPNACNSPQTVSITLKVYNSGSTIAPFGDFSTPTAGSTVCGSIAVTGWVLDDIDIVKVEIFNGTTYVGDAIFVEGARPDVETAYPQYPKNYRAGWGYMLLTNFLSNGGNGGYTLIAKATDAEGSESILGSKTITCDNAHAVKPFGAIDTPTQGGTASGNFTDWGWVLTPQPNYIKTNGTTIDVYVDGVSLGHPKYNLYRADIATLFPGYVNSNNAVGYYTLDTTKYSNGIHSIGWVATDSGGNTGGIGSRFFNIQNAGESLGSSANKINRQFASAGSRAFDLPPNYSTVQVKKGVNRDNDNVQEEVFPDDIGVLRVESKELERIEIIPENIGSSSASTHFAGFMAVGDELRPLPIGSTIDTRSGVFYWWPGAGFIGEYRFVFIRTEETGEQTRTDIIVTILPRF